MPTKKIEMPSLNLTTVEKTADKEADGAAKTLDMIKRTTIKTKIEFETAAQWLAEIKQTRERAETQRTSVVGPLNLVVKTINGWFNPGIKALDEAERLLKQKMVAYAGKADEKRGGLIALAGKAKTHAEREELLEKAEKHAPVEVEGVATRISWTGEVIDADKIPREYLIPDTKALLALTRAKGGDPRIPGWRAFSETTLAVSVEKVKDSSR